MNLMSDSIDKITAALCKFQVAAEPIHKEVKNTFFNSKYADLSNCLDATRKPLSDNGLTIVQPTRLEGEKTVLMTFLLHISGQYIMSEYILNPVKQDPQSLGGALTYARRYCYLAILCLAAEDDDGNVASAPRPSAQAWPKKPEVSSATDPTKMVDALEKLLREQNVSPHLWGEIGRRMKGRYIKDFPGVLKDVLNMEANNAPSTL